MIIVLDTNVLISGTISPKSSPARVLDLWQQGVFELTASAEILDEYERVLFYPHLAIPSKRAASLIQKLRRDVIHVKIPKPFTNVSIDPDDDKFLGCAVVGSASYIVSGDDHLLALKEYGGIPILPPVLFIATIVDLAI